MNRTLLLLLSSTLLLIPAIGCGGGLLPDQQSDPIEPYYDYFISVGPQGVFVVPTLQQKQAFDRIAVADATAGMPPATLPADPNQPVRPTTQPWAQFINRTGTRIYIAGDEELIERIRVAYERREDAMLLPATSAQAPPARDVPLEEQAPAPEQGTD